jgi:hypothetical protein
MLGKKGSIALSVALVLIFSGVAIVTVFDSNTSLSTSTGYLSATSDNINNAPVFISHPGCFQYNITVKTTAGSTVYVFSFSNATTGSRDINITNFYNTSKSPSTPQNNYMKVSNFQNGTVIHLKLYVNSEAFNMMNYFNKNDTQSTLYLVKLVIIGSNNGASATGFAIGKL